MRQAYAKAGWKLGVGLLLVVGALGLRMASVVPGGVDDEIAELDALDEVLSEDARSRGVEAPPSARDETLVARLGRHVRDTLGPGGRQGPDPERLVRCDVDGRSQFMRAAQCQGRGGRSMELE